MKHWSPALKAFLGIFILFEVIGWIFVGSTERLDQLLLINGAHNAFADIAFQALTSIAEVVLPILFLIYLFSTSIFYLSYISMVETRLKIIISES